MKIELACAACGGNHFDLSDANTDDAVIACGDCGHVIGTFGDLKLRLAEEVLRRSKRRDEQAELSS
jgi:uncharacterized Zn finger protein